MYRRPGVTSVGSRRTEKKLYSTEVPGGGKTSTFLRNRAFACARAFRTVAVEATTLGLTRSPPTIHEHIASTAVSYRPTNEPRGPLMRWSSSWMMRSGGRRAGWGIDFTDGNVP